MNRGPIICSPQVAKDLPIQKRQIYSVESSKRSEANQKLVDYYRANPVKNPLLPVNVLDYNGKENGSSHGTPAYAKKPPMPIKYERLIIPHYAPAYVKPASAHAPVNPMRNVGRAILERPHYNVMPQWWG